MPGTDPPGPEPATLEQARAAEYQALEILRSRGYLVLRSGSQGSPVHLMACREKEPPLFVRIKRTRKPAGSVSEVVERWIEEIELLRVLVSLGGTVQFWVHSNQQGWQVYEVLRGGVTEVQD